MDLSAGRFHFHTWEAGGPDVVLVHGAADSSASWHRVGPALAAAGRNAIAIDLRGHGGSVRTPGNYGPRAMARDLGEFITALDLAAPALIGHCWGALVALVLAAKPGAPPLSGLVLEDPPLVLDTSGNEAFLADLDTATHMAPADLATALAAAHPGWDESDRDSLIEGVRGTETAVVAEVQRDGAAFGPFLPLLYDLVPPALLLHGDPAHGGVLAEEHWTDVLAALPAHSRAHRVPGTAHDIHRGHFPLFMRLVQPFLNLADAARCVP